MYICWDKYSKKVGERPILIREGRKELGSESCEQGLLNYPAPEGCLQDSSLFLSSSPSHQLCTFFSSLSNSRKHFHYSNRNPSR